MQYLDYDMIWTFIRLIYNWSNGQLCLYDHGDIYATEQEAADDAVEYSFKCPVKLPSLNHSRVVLIIPTYWQLPRFVWVAMECEPHIKGAHRNMVARSPLLYSNQLEATAELRQSQYGTRERPNTEGLMLKITYQPVLQVEQVHVILEANPLVPRTVKRLL